MSTSSAEMSRSTSTGFHRDSFGLDHNHIELPSMEEVDAIEKQRSRATESLEISDGFCKCQGCGSLKPLLSDNAKLVRSTESKQIHRLRAIIKRIEKYNFGGDISTKDQRQELSQLLEEEKKKDVFRRLPLYSSSATRYFFYCSKCYDTAYSLRRKKESK
jgi:hypothetical protein